MTKKGLDRLQSKTVCTAKRRNGEQCLNYAIKGASVCRMHGGSAPQVRRAAQVRLLMQADNLMSALLKIALNEKLPVQHRLVAIRDGLDRANLAGTQSVELTVEKGRSFEDVTADVVMDLDVDEDDPVYAEVIDDEDDAPLVPRDPDALYEGNRHDRAVFAPVERERSIRQRPGSMTTAERRRAEAEALAAIATPVSRDSRGRAAFLAALDNGASHAEAERAAQAAAEDAPSTGKRRARVSEATISDGGRQRRKR